MRNGNFNGDLWRDKRAEIVTYTDAVERIVRGFEQTGRLNFGSGEISHDVLFLMVVGKRPEVARLLLEASRIREGGSRIWTPLGN